MVSIFDAAQRQNRKAYEKTIIYNKILKTCIQTKNIKIKLVAILENGDRKINVS